ncbi:MAG: hypothetical protein WBH57_11785, partial [Anaerolineae bacterium]
RRTMSVEGLGKQVFAYLSSRERELVDFACQLIYIPGPNPPGDEQVGPEGALERIRTSGLGEFEVMAERYRRPNILLRLSGSRGRRVFKCKAHLDTRLVCRKAVKRRSSQLARLSSLLTTTLAAMKDLSRP